MVVIKTGMSSYDAFAKPMDGIRTRSTAGGIITVIASTTAALLFLSQLYLYAQVEHRHSLHLTESTSNSILTPPDPFNSRQQRKTGQVVNNKLPLEVHVTFPNVKCSQLDYAHDGASKSSGDFRKIHGNNALLMRPPTQDEFHKALGLNTRQEISANKKDRMDGCTIKGTFWISRVGGTLSITVSREAWREATTAMMLGSGTTISEMFGIKVGRPEVKLPNVSHYIHNIVFGDPYPLTANPLSDSPHIIDNELGVGLSNIDVRLVPTKHKKFGRSPRDTYQASVAKHIVQPQTLAAQHASIYPGMSLTYDFTPLTVHHVEHRENFAVFVSSLVSIVGGVFVTVGLVGGCLRSSAAAVSKKID